MERRRTARKRGKAVVQRSRKRGRRRQKLILGVSLLGKGWARKPLGNPNRLIESSLLSSLYRRLEACPISLFLSTRIAAIRLQNLSHVPLHDRFVNRICQLLVLTPPLPLIQDLAHGRWKGRGVFLADSLRQSKKTRGASLSLFPRGSLELCVL